MIRYLVNRLLWTIPVLWVVATITFFLMHATPGSPWQAKLGEKYNEQTAAQLSRKFGLDKPIHIQYFNFLKNSVRLDFGDSYQFGRPVFQIMKEGFPYSARIGLYAFIIALIVGVPLGIIAALRQNTWADYLSLFIATLGYTIPSFVVAIFLLVVFGLRLGWFPVLWPPGGGWKAYVLPSVALGFGSAAFLARLTRSSMLEIVRQDYIRTARAKGLRSNTVTTRHIVRNGLIPVVTILGPALAGLVTGTFIIEFIFGVPGIGKLFVQGVFARDYPIIMASTILYAFFIAMGNLVVDILYGMVDPRIKTG